MTGTIRWLVFFSFVIFTLTRGDDELRWNTPPKLTAGSNGKQSLNNDAIQSRFLPFSASFSLAAGGNNAHSLNVGTNPEGITLSQSTSQNDRLGPVSNAGSLSASQSSSFSVGLSGISASEANAFDLNHSLLGGASQANSNSFTLGEASASSYGKGEKGKVTSGASSSVGYAGSSAEANANYLQNQHKNQQYGRPYWTNISPNYENGGFGSSNPYRPTLQIGQRPQGWSPNNWRRPSQLDISINDNGWNSRVPEVHITDAWQNENTPIRGSWNPYSCYRRPYRFSNLREEYEWNNRCGWDINRYQKQDQFLSTASQTSSPFWTNQRYQKPGLQISAASASSGATSTGDGFSFGQSSSQSNYGLHGNYPSNPQNFNGKYEGSFGSGTSALSSTGNGESIASSNANSGSASSVNFPRGGNSQIIPNEFVRSKQISRDNKRHSRKSQKDPVDQFITDITDTVEDIFDV